MSGNYPDGLSEGTPGAPWNQPDPDPLVCDECQHEEEYAEVGDACLSPDDAQGNPCPGHYREADHCPWCSRMESRCVCDP